MPHAPQRKRTVDDSTKSQTFSSSVASDPLYLLRRSQGRLQPPHPPSRHNTSLFKN